MNRRSFIKGLLALPLLALLPKGKPAKSVWGGNITFSGEVPDGHIYFLNTENLKMMPYKPIPWEMQPGQIYGKGEISG
jgi:hypothetical protein